MVPFGSVPLNHVRHKSFVAAVCRSFALKRHVPPGCVCFAVCSLSGMMIYICKCVLFVLVEVLLSSPVCVCVVEDTLVCDCP